MRQFRGLRSQRIPYPRDVEADNALYDWIEPSPPGPEAIFAEGPVARHKQIKALSESYPMVYDRCREAVCRRHMTGGEAAELLGNLLSIRAMLEAMAMSEPAKKRTRKAVAA